MLFTSTPSLSPATLVYLCKLLCLKYVLPTHSTTLLPLSLSPGTTKAPVMGALVLSHISFFILSFIGAVPHYHKNFNPWKFEFDPENFRAYTLKIYHCILPYIIQQDSQPFPSSFELLDTSNDAIYSTPWDPSVQVSISSPSRQALKFSFSKNIHYLLPLHSIIYSSYIPCT